MKLFIIVLNFNNKRDSVNCLSLFKKIPTNLVFIDNASKDGSVETIKKKFPKITVIENKKNLGFAAGNNVGIKYALDKGADWILILNNDVTFDPKKLKILENNKADIIGAVLKFERDGKTIYDLGGYFNKWTGRAFHDEVESESKIKPKNPDYVSGAFMLVKREVFEKIGLFDESYFLYYEDTDFCTRAKRASFTISVDPEFIVFHKLGGSAGRKSWITLYQNLKSNLIFINKNIDLYRRPVGISYWLLLTLKVVFNYCLSTLKNKPSFVQS